jgi:hypothetical protein
LLRGVRAEAERGAGTDRASRRSIAGRPTNRPVIANTVANGGVVGGGLSWRGIT